MNGDFSIKIYGTVGMSIIDPLTCGLASFITYKYLTTNHTKTKNHVKRKILLEKYEKELVFGAYCFNISYITFRSKYPTIIQIYGIERQKIFQK